MQTDLFPAINSDLADFNNKLTAKISDLRAEIDYLERLRHLVEAAYNRDKAAQTNTFTSDPVTDELESGMRKIALKLAPEKAR